MTRHAAYAPRARHPFATFPHADAARLWLANHPEDAARTRFVPPLPAEETASAFGTWENPCGCPGDAGDPHLADCPTRTGGAGMSYDDHYARLSRPGYDEYYDAP